VAAGPRAGHRGVQGDGAGQSSGAALITAQLRRSALSIAANIAEGRGKSSRAETIRYLEIAAGSAAETEHHLLVARDIGVFTTRQAERFLSTIGSVRRMLGALIRRLPPDPAKASKPLGAKESA
jgi:four helix bundle protein